MMTLLGVPYIESAFFETIFFTPDTMQCYCALYDDNAIGMFDYEFIECAIRSVLYNKCACIDTE